MDDDEPPEFIDLRVLSGKRQTADTFPRRELPVNTAVRARTILQ